MSDLSGYDAAYPPANPPPDQVVFGYLGGNTPHPWTAEEWAAQPARYRAGIWTRSNPIDAAQGTTEGRAALAAWRALGAPAGTLLVLDLETAINAPYVTAFDAVAVAGGCRVAAYGSKATLFNNPRPSGGFFTADLTGIPHLFPGTTITQFEFETGWDDDEVSGSITGWLWNTRPMPKPPAPPAAPAPILEEDDMPEMIKPLSAYPDGKYAYDVPDGKTQLRLTADGDKGPVARIRIAFWQHDSPLVQGSAPNYVEIGGSAPHHTIGISLPAGCTGVTVTREDLQDFPVALGFHA